MEIVSVSIEETVKGIEDLERKVQGDIVKKSLRAGAKITLKAARSNAPVRTGLVKRSIKIKTGKKRKGRYSLEVGIPKGSEGWYGILVERGHRIGKQALGDARKQVEGAHMIGKAYDSTKDTAVEVVRETALEMIEQATT